MIDQNNEQPPSNPAGPAASEYTTQQPTEGIPMSALCFSGRHSGCRGDNGYGEKCGCDCHKQPAEAVSEAVSEAAREASEHQTPITDKAIRNGGGCHYVDRNHLHRNPTFQYVDPSVARSLERTTAAQQAEIAALREELVKSAASNANEIAALRSQLQEAKRLNGELKEEREKYQGAATLAVCCAHIGVPLPDGITCLYCEVNAAVKERNEARYIASQVARDLEIKRQKYGKIDADIRQAVRATGFCEIEGSTVGLVGSICDLATQRVKELEELRAARRKEVRITFDKIEGSFSVTFGRTGRTVKFEKPKHVAGNVENWLANLRHAED